MDLYIKSIKINGFYKDQYFILLFDLIDKKENKITNHNHIIFIKADWSLIKVNNELHLYQINSIKNKKYKYFYMPLRNFFEKNNDLSIEDILLKAEKSEFETKKFADFKDQFQWFLGIGLLFLIIDVLLLEKKTTWIQKLNLFNQTEKNEK